jgi:hypothetical protein
MQEVVEVVEFRCDEGCRRIGQELSAKFIGHHFHRNTQEVVSTEQTQTSG